MHVDAGTSLASGDFGSLGSYRGAHVLVHVAMHETQDHVVGGVEQDVELGVAADVDMVDALRPRCGPATGSLSACPSPVRRAVQERPAAVIARRADVIGGRWLVGSSQQLSIPDDAWTSVRQPLRSQTGWTEPGSFMPVTIALLNRANAAA